MHNRIELKIAVHNAQIFSKVHLRLWIYHEHLSCSQKINKHNEFRTAEESFLRVIHE
jgi:hypothetical protein